MSIFSPLGFTRLATKHRDIFERISDDLTLPNDPNHEARREAFLKTADTMDSAKAGQMVDEAIRAYSGCRTAGEGLRRFCEQMGIPTNELAHMSEAQRITYIASCGDAVRKKLGI